MTFNSYSVDQTYSREILSDANILLDSMSFFIFNKFFC